MLAVSSKDIQNSIISWGQPKQWPLNCTLNFYPCPPLVYSQQASESTTINIISLFCSKLFNGFLSTQNKNQSPFNGLQGCLLSILPWIIQPNSLPFLKHARNAVEYASPTWPCSLLFSAPSRTTYLTTYFSKYVFFSKTSFTLLYLMTDLVCLLLELSVLFSATEQNLTHRFSVRY